MATKRSASTATSTSQDSAKKAKRPVSVLTYNFGGKIAVISQGPRKAYRPRVKASSDMTASPGPDVKHILRPGHILFLI